MTVTVREAVQADAEAIASIHRTSRQFAMPWLPILHSPAEDIWFFKTIAIVKENVKIACRGSQVIGFVSFKDQWLNHLYVDPAHLRQGVGTELLEVAKASTGSLQLWTFQQNHLARGFYSVHGFEEQEFTDGQNCEEKTPDVRMVWNAVL